METKSFYGLVASYTRLNIQSGKDIASATSYGTYVEGLQQVRRKPIILKNRYQARDMPPHNP